jgi:N utilization substance protein B
METMVTEHNGLHQSGCSVPCGELSQRDQRSLIFHLLYAVDASDYEASLEAIAENFSREYGCVIYPQDFVFMTARAVIATRDEVDAEIKQLLANWRFERLGMITRLLMRYALWELIYTDTPSSVVINEAVELAKSFAEDNAYRFINGLLDEWCKQHGRESASAE